MRRLLSPPPTNRYSADARASPIAPLSLNRINRNRLEALRITPVAQKVAAKVS
jgi:hypothetical protein